jgi:two-component system nitrate/nitrite response regulator NarL
VTGTNDTTSIRVLIVAAYASVRAGLHALLADSGGVVPAGEARGSGELAQMLADAAPDVVLCDSAEGDGIRVLQALDAASIGLVVLDDGTALAGPLAASSVPGYALLRRDADGPALAAAVRAVAAGLAVFDRSLVTPVPLPVSGAPASLPDGESLVEALTAREREVLQLMAQGLPNKTIATRLGISPHTAKFHVAAVLAKLGATSRAEAVTLGARRGYLLL